MQEYLKSSLLTTREKQLTFALRSGSYNLKVNYKSRFDKDMKCRICSDENSSEDKIHTFENCSELIDISYKHIRFSHLFGSVKEQVNAMKYFSQIITKRDIILEVKNMN